MNLDIEMEVWESEPESRQSEAGRESGVVSREADWQTIDEAGGRGEPRDDEPRWQSEQTGREWSDEAE